MHTLGRFLQCPVKCPLAVNRRLVGFLPEEFRRLSVR